LPSWALSWALVQLAAGDAPVTEVPTGEAHGKLLTRQIVTVTTLAPDAPVPVNMYFLLPPFRTTLVIVSALLTVIDGDVARLVSVPPLVDFCCACHVCAPVLDVAVAPGPLDAVLP
jgi:hypothetical protein